MIINISTVSNSYKMLPSIRNKSSSCYNREINSNRIYRYQCSKRFALKDGALEKLQQLQIEYDGLLEKYPDTDNNSYEDSNEDIVRINELKIIFKCVDALKSIDNDLQLFAEHESSKDSSLKKRAKLFTEEFLVCKNDIEQRLNELL